MTDYRLYRTMEWTSDNDPCEEDCGRTMAEGRYVEGRYGHYCSYECSILFESGVFPNERATERRQMGIC